MERFVQEIKCKKEISKKETTRKAEKGYYGRKIIHEVEMNDLGATLEEGKKKVQVKVTTESTNMDKNNCYSFADLEATHCDEKKFKLKVTTEKKKKYAGGKVKLNLVLLVVKKITRRRI